ncbi:MAG TPA: DUF5723 family protein, partial [Saprospiraceae bacterium]|nr:DUF5723 family protein [Saprospiraceae bacterium]
EVGVNYAQSLELGEKPVDVGISVKYLNGYDMVSIQSKTRYDHAVINTNDFSMTGTNFEYAYSPIQSMFSQVRGRGASVDIGMSYTLPSNDKKGYQWKIGASITDIGWLKFNNIRSLGFQS